MFNRRDDSARRSRAVKECEFTLSGTVNNRRDKRTAEDIIVVACLHDF